MSRSNTQEAFPQLATKRLVLREMRPEDASRCKSVSSGIFAIKPVGLPVRDNSGDEISLPW